MMTNTKEKRPLWKIVELWNLCEKRQVSESTNQVITHILKATRQRREQRYQTISRITDILQESKTEEEFLQKLRENFPESF